MTRQRNLVQRILTEECRHLSASEIWDIARQKGEKVSLATVYNSLRVLVETEVVQEIQRANEGAVYDARIDPHAHLLCTSCGELKDLDIRRGVSALEREAREITGYSALRSDITLKGVCPECAKR